MTRAYPRPFSPATIPVGMRKLPIIEYQVGMPVVVGALEAAAVALPVMVFMLVIGALRHLRPGVQRAAEP
jgi:hypothetical protein